MTGARATGLPRTRAHLVVAQGFISLIMTFLMTGFFTAVPERLAPGWTSLWLTRFVVVGPVAFALGLVIGPIGFRLAHLVLGSATGSGADRP